MLLWFPSAFLLTACGGLTSVEAVDFGAAPQASLTLACGAPVLLPERALSDRDVEIYWGRDRRALRECGSRHSALAEAANGR
jgi:hypothetical protein